MIKELLGSMCEETGREGALESGEERERWRDPAYLNFSQALTQSTVAVGEDYPAKTRTSPPR